MKYEVKKVENSQMKVSIELENSELEKYKDQACKELSQEVKIKGFRPGHVPANVLEEQLGETTIKEHAKEIAIRKYFTEVIIKENIQVISRPHLVVDSHEPLKFTLTFAVMPEVEVKGYKDIKIKKEEVKVDPKELDDIFENMKKYGTSYKEVERAAKKGDRVELDFEGYNDKDEAVANTKSINHPVILGENTLIPGFEEEVIGLKKGEKKEFDITFPKDYAKEDFKGKKLKFKIELKMVEEALVPELNEELIEKLTGKKQSIEEFKKELEENLKSQKELDSKKKRENDYIEKLVEKTKVELPEALVEEESRHILQEMKDEIAAKGMDFAKFTEQAKTSEEELLKKYKSEAERRIKVRLALQYVLKEEKIEVSEDEIKAEFEKIKSMYPKTEAQKIEKDYNEGALKGTIENRLILGKFFKAVLES